jgi:hypothetical protein
MKKEKGNKGEERDEDKKRRKGIQENRETKIRR